MSNHKHAEYYTWLHRHSTINRQRGRERSYAFANDKAAWAALKKERAITKFENMPVNVFEKMLKLKDHILKQDPFAEIKLTGSWYKGSWVLEETDEKIFALRKRVTGKRGLSDFDIVIKSCRRFASEELSNEINAVVQVWNVDFEKTKGILIK